MAENLELYDLACRDTLTYNVYVALACSDIPRLDNARALVARHCGRLDATVSSSALYFGNHPIRWIQVVGTALDVAYSPSDVPKECIFAVADGLGGPPLPCFINFRHSPCGGRIQTGDKVVVLARLNSPTRAEVTKLHTVPASDLNLFYMMREEAVATRKFVLEHNAEHYRGQVPVLKSIETPKQKSTSVITGRTSELQWHLRKRAAQFGVLNYVSTVGLPGTARIWPLAATYP